LFGSLLGFVGLLVAVPLAVLVKLLAQRAIARYRTSPLYGEGAGPAAAAG
jgi:predicted PurR-regulated permease PerM